MEMTDEKMEREKTMKTMVIKMVVVMVIFGGAFTLKNFTNFVDKAYGDGEAPTIDRAALVDEAVQLIGKVQEYERQRGALDAIIARTNISHSTRGLTMKEKHELIKSNAQVLLDKIEAFMRKVHDAHMVEIEATLRSKKESLTGDLRGQDELIEKALKELLTEWASAADESTCPDPGAVTPEPKKPVVTEADDADKYIEAALWEEVLENLEPDFSAELSREELKELKTDITKAVAEFVETYVAQYQARIDSPFAFIDSRDEKDQRLYYNPDRQLRKVARKIKELEAALKVEGLSTTDANKLRLELFTAKQLKSYFEKYIRGVNTHTSGEEDASVPSGGGIDQETMAMLMLLNSQGMLSQEEMQMLLMGGGAGSSSKPKTGFGIKLGSTPWGGVDVGFDYNNQDYGMSMGGTFGNEYRGFPGMPGGMPGMMGPGFNPADPYSDPSMWFRR